MKFGDYYDMNHVHNGIEYVLVYQAIHISVLRPSNVSQNEITQLILLPDSITRNYA